MEYVSGAKDIRNIVFVVCMSDYQDVVAYVADRVGNTLHGLNPVWIRKGKPNERQDLGKFARSVFGTTLTKKNKGTYHVSIGCMPNRLITLKLKKPRDDEPSNYPGRVVAYVKSEDGSSDLILQEVIAEVQKAPPDLKKMTIMCKNTADDNKRIEQNINVTNDMKSKFDFKQMAFS